MLARPLSEHDDRPVEDNIVVLRQATWADYQRLLERLSPARRERGRGTHGYWQLPLTQPRPVMLALMIPPGCP
jgi:hypothetical protein